MTDLRARLHIYDQTPAPELWTAIERRANPEEWAEGANRATRPQLRRVEMSQVVPLAVAAVALVAAAIGYQLVTGQLPGDPGPPPVPPASGPPASVPLPDATPGSTAAVDLLPPPPQDGSASGPAGNGLVAYQLGEDIYLGDPRTGETWPLVAGTHRDIRPVFSPDGLTVAFQRLGASPRNDTIAVVSPDGSEPRIVVPAGLSNKEYGSPVWTPDSASILVVHNGMTNETPYWDGEWSLFDAVGAGGRRDLNPPLPLTIGAIPFIDNAGVAPMFRPPAADLILSPSGGGIEVFDTQLASLGQLGRNEIESLGLHGVGGPTWSPDASKISFGASGGDVAPHGSGTGVGGSYGTWASYVMDADGTHVRLLGAEIYNATWSPDGTTLGEGAQDYSGGPGVVLVDVATGSLRLLEPPNPPEDPEAWGWSWSPDGRSVVMFEIGHQPTVVDVTTGAAYELPWAMDSAPSWQRVPQN